MSSVVVDTAGLRRDLERHRAAHEGRIRRLLERVGERTVEHLRSFTDEKVKPEPISPEDAARVRVRYQARNAESLADPDPKKRAEARRRVEVRIRQQLASLRAIRRRRARRPRHPGHWADRTGDLARSYGYEVRREAGRWALAITNDAPHAHLVEVLDGFFVVRGVAEPGGPVYRALRRAMRELAPDWALR